MTTKRFDSDTNRSTRRTVMKFAGVATAGAALGGAMPDGFVSKALAQAAPTAAEPKTLKFEGKVDGLVVLGEKPLVAETPPHLMNDDVTPNDKFFIRNNGLMPEPLKGDAKAWKIKIDGEVNNPMEIALGDLMSRFAPVTYRLQMECGGNGRSYFTPEARGNQWTNGGMGCAEWTGIPLAEVLKAAGLKPSAVYTGHYGADKHLSGDDKPSISRGMRIEKAMEPHTLIAFKMNGQDIPLVHGAPVRLIVPGWPGSLSTKWLTRIWIRDKEHDGPGMGGASYRVTRTPIVPGSRTPDSNMVIMESMPVRSIVTSPGHGAALPDGTRSIDIRGAAWAGEDTVSAVDVSLDYGATWTKATVSAPANKYAWQRWTAKAALPGPGYYEIWSRATDSAGRMQPIVAGNWNPQGYGGNPISRNAVLVKA